MNKIYGIILLIIVLSFTYCTDEWEQHYQESDNTVDVKLWDTLKTIEKYSEFVKYVELFNLDSIIKSSNTKTVFIPDNQAFAEYLKGDTTGFKEAMRYHITPTLFMIRNVENNKKRRLKTVAEKYALIENIDYNYQYDGINIKNKRSPLFLDGKYYEIDSLVEPKPNLYEYIKWNNPAVRKYIDTKDSIVLDKEESKPLGYNEEGQTIYDSVTTVINEYEEEYFPISKESRYFSATLILPDQSSYESALDGMAQRLGGSFKSHEDIPEKWQNNVLIPVLLDQGTYGGLRDPEFFDQRKVANIKGDSTILTNIEIDPQSKVICSNGLVYDYQSFSIGDSLYYGENKLEGETLCEAIGAGRFSWIDDKVKVERDRNYQPVKQEVPGFTSNDSTMFVQFDNNYEGKYTVTFEIEDLFPGTYRFVWQSNYRITGEWAIYINGEKVKEYDTYNLVNSVFSVSEDIYKFWPNERGFNKFDFWVEDLITEYGDVKIKLEYLGPGESSSNGLSIDYISLIPKKN